MSYPGGKNGSGVFQSIINLIPPHRVYIEPFLGSGAIMRLKRPAGHSLGIEIDSTVILSFPVKETPNLTLIFGNAITYLEQTRFESDNFIYIDPPYLMETRSTKRKIYKDELSDQQHIQLLEIIKRQRAMIMISGYANALYDVALADWRTHTFQTTNRGGQHVTETLWMNYPQPVELHDYRFLGNNFRERERIKRKKQRWTSRLVKMPILERQALAAAIAETRERAPV